MEACSAACAALWAEREQLLRQQLFAEWSSTQHAAVGWAGSLASRRQLMEWEHNDMTTNIVDIIVVILLVLGSGLMSGLTLGLLSLDMVEMEVLKRSGTPSQKRNAEKIMPVIKDTHLLLVTLLLCNAGCMEALPIFLNSLVNEVTAILVSVTAILIFGEILPQSICKRHGLAIGAFLAWPVRLLMLLCFPVAWPIGKLLDFLLEHEDYSMFRRRELKALVDMHGADEGLGGKLSDDEVQIICGALDLTSKVAYLGMTPLAKVVSLSTDDKLNQPLLKMVLDSGHSRLPVHEGSNKANIIGLVLTKDLLNYNLADEVPVRYMRIRPLPRLSATTPMYDMLKLFRTGRSHMAVLTQPEPGGDQDLSQLANQMAARVDRSVRRKRSLSGERLAQYDSAPAGLSRKPTGNVGESMHSGEEPGSRIRSQSGRPAYGGGDAASPGPGDEGRFASSSGRPRSKVDRGSGGGHNSSDGMAAVAVPPLVRVRAEADAAPASFAGVDVGSTTGAARAPEAPIHVQTQELRLPATLDSPAGAGQATELTSNTRGSASKPPWGPVSGPGPVAEGLQDSDVPVPIPGRGGRTVGFAAAAPEHDGPEAPGGRPASVAVQESAAARAARAGRAGAARSAPAGVAWDDGPEAPGGRPDSVMVGPAAAAAVAAAAAKAVHAVTANDRGPEAPGGRPGSVAVASQLPTVAETAVRSAHGQGHRDQGMTHVTQGAPGALQLVTLNEGSERPGGRPDSVVFAGSAAPATARAAVQDNSEAPGGWPGSMAVGTDPSGTLMGGGARSKGVPAHVTVTMEDEHEEIKGDDSKSHHQEHGLLARLTAPLRRHSRRSRRASTSSHPGDDSSSDESSARASEVTEVASSVAVARNVVPLIAEPGTAIGIITIEDVLEELMGREILDETDHYADNERTIKVNEAVRGEMYQALDAKIRATVSTTLIDTARRVSGRSGNGGSVPNGGAGNMKDLLNATAMLAAAAGRETGGGDAAIGGGIVPIGPGPLDARPSAARPSGRS